MFYISQIFFKNNVFHIFSGKPVIFEISKVEVTKDFEPDNELATALEKYSEKMDLELIKELGEFECDLEGRFSLIRTQETNLGNFICDIMVNICSSLKKGNKFEISSLKFQVLTGCLLKSVRFLNCIS